MMEVLTLTKAGGIVEAERTNRADHPSPQPFLPLLPWVGRELSTTL